MGRSRHTNPVTPAPRHCITRPPQGLTLTYSVWDKNDGVVRKDKEIGAAGGALACRAVRVGGTEVRPI